MAPVDLPEDARRPELTLAAAESEENGASFDSPLKRGGSG